MRGFNFILFNMDIRICQYRPTLGDIEGNLNQVLAQIELWENHQNYENKVYVLPKKLDEMVAMFHLKKVGAKLTEMSKDQSDYIGVDQQGPFKKETYRY